MRFGQVHERVRRILKSILIEMKLNNTVVFDRYTLHYGTSKNYHTPHRSIVDLDLEEGGNDKLYYKLCFRRGRLILFFSILSLQE